jgi:hypothetical protein
MPYSLLLIPCRFSHKVMKSEFFEALLTRISSEELVWGVSPWGIGRKDPLRRFGRQVFFNDIGRNAVFCFIYFS